jgi:protein-S-isoprenylcysteine O-methyltransferase Ste14
MDSPIPLHCRLDKPLLDPCGVKLHLGLDIYALFWERNAAVFFTVFFLIARHLISPARIPLPGYPVFGCLRIMKSRKDIYAAQGRSIAQRICMSLAVGICVCLAWWVLFGHVVAWFSAELGRFWSLGDETRRLSLGSALTIYFLRLLFTQFVFLRRAVAWSEAAAIVTWILLIYLILTFAAATNPASFSSAGAAGCLLFALGSWMNSFAEYTRHVWKERPGNRGRLYTLGLFRYSRHPNYLGDLISFSGLCLITGRWATLAIPLVMLGGFVFVNIPMLDSHLRGRYGVAFDDYAARTRKLVPFIY